MAVLVKREGDPQHFSCEHHCCRRLAQAFGKLRVIVRAPQLHSCSGPAAVKEQAPLFGRAAFAQPPPAVFLARIIGSRIKAGGGDHRVAGGIRHFGEAIAQAHAGERANTGYGGNVVSRLTDRGHLLRGALHQQVQPRNHAIDVLDELARWCVERGQSAQALPDAVLGLYELRTPITALALQMDLLETARGAVERKEAVADMRRGIERIRRLVEQLLTLARLDPANPVRRDDIDLGRFIEDVCQDFQPMAKNNSTVLTYKLNGHLMVRTDSSSLRMLVSNLLDNAVRYTPRHGKVSVGVSASANATEATIEIADSGPGIPPELRGEVRRRYFRGRHDGDAIGTGLGLAIAQQVAERLGGRLELHDAVDGNGLRAVVRIPVALSSGAAKSIH